jgi:hypothetical protein
MKRKEVIMLLRLANKIFHAECADDVEELTQKPESFLKKIKKKVFFPKLVYWATKLVCRTTDFSPGYIAE